jgi:hypothetical protein
MPKQLRNVAKFLDIKLSEIAGRKMLFSLLIFNTESGSRMSYISNTNRDDVIAAMKALIDGWENGMPDIPAHKII